MSAARFPGKLYELEELILDGKLTSEQLIQLALLVSSIESFRRSQIEDESKQAVADFEREDLRDASYWRVLSGHYEKFVATLQQPKAAP